MKKNLTYLAILLSLLGFTYLYQELGWWGNRPKSVLAKLDYGDLDTLELKSGRVDLKPVPILKFFNQQTYPGNVDALKAFWGEVNKVRVKKELNFQSEEYKNYFSPLASRLKLRLSNLEEVELVLGEMVPDSEDFYWLEISKNKSKLYIAELLQEANGAEYYEAQDRYKQIKAIFDLSIERFFFQSIFPETVIEESTALHFNHTKKKAFQFQLNEEHETESAGSFAINWDKLEAILLELKGLRGELLTTTDPKGELITTLEFKHAKGEATAFHLYHVIKGEAGYYVQKNQEPFWIRLPLGKENNFLMNEMDFWTKTIFSKTGMPKGDFKVQIFFPSKNSLTYSPVNNARNIREANHLPKKAITNLLFLNSLVFGFAPYQEADRVSAYDATDLKIKKPSFEIRVGDVKLFVSKSNDEILLMNPKERYTLHYYMSELRLKAPISELEKDYQ